MTRAVVRRWAGQYPVARLRPTVLPGHRTDCLPPINAWSPFVRVRLPLLAALAAAGLAGTVAATGAGAAPSFPPASQASVRPGAVMVTDGAQCTANFVFTDGAGDVLLGMAAHCAGSDGDATATNGCDAGSLPLGTRVDVDGATRPGTLVYSSWLAMQQAGETDQNACRFNDFALVRLDPADVGRTNPTVPVFGGPNALDREGTRAGEPVVSYGNSGLRLGLTETSPKRGYSLGTSGGGWTHDIYTATPGIPGDSGSGVLDDNGAAIGTLSTVALAPFAGSNGVSDLQRQLAYARVHGAPGTTLVPGTVAYKGFLAG